MRHGRFLALFLGLTASLLAQPDPAAGGRARQELDRQESEALQKVDRAEELERNQLRFREREEYARIQREAAAGGAAAAGTDKLVQYTFAQDEVRNLIQNQLGAELTVRFKRERNAISRQYRLERARLEAGQIDAGDDTARQRERAVASAELAAKYQAQLDDLALEEEAEAARIRFHHTTVVNAAERDLAVLSARLMISRINQGSTATYNPAADPEIARLFAARDAAKHALETALDELKVRFSVRRTGIETARDAEPAKPAAP